ncbi:ribosome recycling factor [Candidatus Peregrinibacteria bacterium]|jgi:ribosome recycling factor|nr:ribosome recycling factor [Candidatus Peregrinibacteria bacterium]
MPTQTIIQNAKQQFQKAIDHLHREFSQLQAGQASSAMVENILVEAYGTPSPLKNSANISVPEPQQLSIEPYDKSLLSPIETAIRNSGMGLNPLNDGSGVIRINIPPLTEERRRDLVKVVHAKAEEAHVAIRQARQDSLHSIRKLEDLSEDLIKQAEEELQEEVNNANKEVDNNKKQKEDDVMKV